MTKPTKPVSAHTHADARVNIPPGEMEAFMAPEDRDPVRVVYEKLMREGGRPELVWRGKFDAEGNDAPLEVPAPPIYLQEQVHPKALIEDLRAGRPQADDLFAHFGVADEDREAEIEFYSHPMRWSNRMILGDSLQVMASLAEREGLRGKVQCVYIDPPYGIRFNSNFQWSTTSRDVKDGNLEHLTREPEQVRAFRDTWRDGVHSYLSYLRDRLFAARDLLTDSGSCFVQIGDENVHRVRALMDEVFGSENFIAQIQIKKSGGATSAFLPGVTDYLVWCGRSKENVKYHTQYVHEGARRDEDYGLVEYDLEQWITASAAEAAEIEGRALQLITLTSQRQGRDTSATSAMGFEYQFRGTRQLPSKGRGWTTTKLGLDRLSKSLRIAQSGEAIRLKKYLADNPGQIVNDFWDDVIAGAGRDKSYVVQTGVSVIQRCILMTTDPGDLVLDPTCGSGTTATVAEQWGRRWITVDTSRVALALARARLMGAKYPYYLLADSREGRAKEAELTGKPQPDVTPGHDLRRGFVYHRVPHVTLKSIANNPEIDDIWDRLQPAVEAARADLNDTLRGQPEPFEVTTGGRAGQAIRFDGDGEPVTMPSGETAPSNGFMEWEIPRQPGTPWPAQQLKWLETARKTTAKGAPTKAAREALKHLNHARGLSLTHDTLPERGVTPWPAEAEAALEAFWVARIARQREIDASIARRADTETLYDKPYTDPNRIRVAGPFTVESLSPHRTPAIGPDGDILADPAPSAAMADAPPDERDAFFTAILENLKAAGVQQPAKDLKIDFTAVEPSPGRYIGAVGRYLEGEEERVAGIVVGPEYGVLGYGDLTSAAQEAAKAGCDILIACAFNFGANTDVEAYRGLPILRARMNPDLHMAGDLKAGGGNLFVVFGEPDVFAFVGGTEEAANELRRLREEIVGLQKRLEELAPILSRKVAGGDDEGKAEKAKAKAEAARVTAQREHMLLAVGAAEKLNDGEVLIDIRGVDVFNPKNGEFDCVGPEGIACWFVDTDYSGESFFVRHAYFLGAGDPYKSLRTTLKDEIDREAWESLNSAISRPFPRPTGGKIAVKAINHLGDEVMRVFDV